MISRWRCWLGVFVLMCGLQLFGYPPKTEIVGWDYCFEEGHPFIVYTYTFGFPFPIKIVRLVYGCLTTPHVEGMIDYNAIFYDLAFVIPTLWIFSKMPEEKIKNDQ